MNAPVVRVSPTCECCTLPVPASEARAGWTRCERCEPPFGHPTDRTCRRGPIADENIDYLVGPDLIDMSRPYDARDWGAVR